jgi:hypothetical protein
VRLSSVFKLAVELCLTPQPELHQKPRAIRGILKTFVTTVLAAKLHNWAVRNWNIGRLFVLWRIHRPLGTGVYTPILVVNLREIRTHLALLA